MNYRKMLRGLVFGLIALMLVMGVAGCGDSKADEDSNSITILIPDNPVAFNGINTDTGYEQAL